MKKLAESRADETTQSSVRITAVYIRSHGFTDPEVIRTLDRIVFYSWRGKAGRYASDKTPIGKLEFGWYRDQRKWLPSRGTAIIAETRELIVKDKVLKHWHKIH